MANYITIGQEQVEYMNWTFYDSYCSYTVVLMYYANICNVVIEHCTVYRPYCQLTGF